MITRGITLDCHRWEGLARSYPHQVALEDPHRRPPQPATIEEQAEGVGPAVKPLNVNVHTSVTFTQLWDQMLGLAGGLYALGLRPGERVSLFSENSSRWLIADQVWGSGAW